MQSGGGYGGVSEIQQFMVDNSSLFAISSSSASAATPAADATALTHHPFKYQPPQMPPPFSHFQPIPATQQLLHQPPPPPPPPLPPHHHHQYFHLFHPPPSPPPPQPTQQQYLPETRRFIPSHHLGGAAMDQDSCPDNSAASGGTPRFLASAMSFKLAVDGGSCERIDDDGGGMLRGDDVSESRLHHWQREDDSGIEELPWRPLDIDYIDRNNKRRKDEEAETGSSSNFSKKSKDMVDSERGEVAGGSNYKIFSELEAIYKPGGSVNVGQTGSGSALTGEEIIHPVLHAAAVTPPQDAGVGGVSETSAGEEPTETVKNSPSEERSRRRRRRKRRLRQLNAMAAFFQRLVKQLMDHQEGLHRKFLELMEQREQELAGHEQAWRKQNAANSSREEAARAHERALSTSREAAIVSFIEKMTGQHLRLPSIPPQLSTAEELHKIQKPSPDAFNNAGDGSEEPPTLNTRRWPKAEVQELIGVRSRLEGRFHEPGLKGPLWEQVSSAMATMGYRRSAKRCKEKWENINKYFRKAKEKGRKPPEQSKTCPYFHQLDQLYSKTKNPAPSAHLNSPLHSPNTIPTVIPPAVGESSRLTPGEEDDEEQRSEEEEEEEEEESHGNPMQW